MEPASQVGRPPITAGATKFYLAAHLTPTTVGYHRRHNLFLETCSIHIPQHLERPHCIFSVGLYGSVEPKGLSSQDLSSSVQVCCSRLVVVVGSLRLRR